MSRSKIDQARSEEDLLVLPLDFEMERSGRVLRRFLIGLSCLTIFSIGVLAVAPIQEIAAASGEIRPSGDLVEVQHPEGGEVATVLAHRGAIVRPGDPILRLRPVGARTDLDRLAVRRASLALTRERLRALLANRAPAFELSPTLAPEAATNEQALYALERRSLERRLAALQSRLRQRRAEVESKGVEIAEIEAELAAYREQIAMRKKLLKKGYAARSDYLSLKAQYAEGRSRQALAQGQLATARESIAEIEEEIAETEASQRAQWSREQTEAESEIAELDRQIEQQADRLNRLTVRSPAFGVVHELHVATPGSVAPPGGKIATVVPLDGIVTAEVRISPDDVGHIRTGDPAVVRVSTFDPEIVGEIFGTVRRLSPTAFTDEQGGKYFKADLRLDRTEVTLAGRPQKLTPGMAVNAQIRTGEKSVLRYLFKPVVRGLDKAFSER